MRKISLVCCVVCGMLFASCNDWLDLKPYGEVEADKMFETEQGYLQTLAGSYLLLTDPSAYGYELTAGFPDEIVHYWKKQSEFYEFDYTNMDVEGRLNATWAKMYEAIANTNLLLGYLENADPNDIEHYNWIKGESLGLRAYLHLDLLRLYGPVLQGDGMQQKSIPYHEEFSNQIVQLMTAEEVISRIQRDLDSAYVLLADDPIKVNGRDQAKDEFNGDDDVETERIPGFAVTYRGSHMNYYAVCATLARLYQLKGDQQNALKYAMEVIDGGKDVFEFVRREDLAEGEPDRMFERELIWSVYDMQIKAHLADELKSSEHSLDNLFMEYVYEDSRSYGSEEDYRENWWITEFNSSPAFWYVCKYDREFSLQDQSDVTPYRAAIPMIRLTEMYYIAAEANLETNPAESYRLLNAVRESRNIGALPTSIEQDANALREQLIYECQKEYWGEGKLFYFNKRLFLNIQTREENIPASEAIYELPIPDDEIEFGDNNNK